MPQIFPRFAMKYITWLYVFPKIEFCVPNLLSFFFTKIAIMLIKQPVLKAFNG